MRISIYIDGANFFYGMRSIRSWYTDFVFDFVRFIDDITSKDTLVDVYYFNAPLKQNLNPDLYAKQISMFARLRNAGYNVILCKRKQRITPGGYIRHEIKEDDIRLALQMYKDAWENKFDMAYLFSCDGDFVPLPEYLGPKGKKIKVFYFQKMIAPALLRKCDDNCLCLNKKIVNKYFLR